VFILYLNPECMQTSHINLLVFNYMIKTRIKKINCYQRNCAINSLVRHFFFALRKAMIHYDVIKGEGAFQEV